jgi:hypothetical protein
MADHDPRYFFTFSVRTTPSNMDAAYSFFTMGHVWDAFGK